jgi:plastocyanin
LKEISGKKFTTLFLLILLGSSIVAGLFYVPSVHATGVSTSLIGNLESVVSAVNYTSNIDAIYQGMIVGETTLQQLINAYNALPTESFSGSDCQSLQIASEVLYWTPILAKLGYTNETTIKWALNSQAMMNDGLPYCYNDGSSEAFLVYDRYLILAYGYAIQYNYELSKWNLTQAYDSFKAAVTASTYPALLWIDQDGTPYTISYGPRYYDECGETIDCFLGFYSLGITTALNDALTTWLWTNNNLWSASGTNYNYALNWAGYECEAGGFLQIALKLWHVDSSLPDTQHLLTDIENRFLAEQLLSPQWLDGVVCHMGLGQNDQLRLENTVMAWAAIFGSYGELNSTYQTDVQDMLTGAGGTATPAWTQLLQSSLCGSNFPKFQDHSDSGVSNDATATGADLLFMLGIVPQTAVLAMPIEENLYEYVYNMLDPDLFNINLTTDVVTVSLAAAGTLNFQFNQTVPGTFTTPGIYTVQFSPDWNTILSITFLSELPSNRQYVYNTMQTPLSSYYITSSADSNSIISPSGNVVVNPNFSQTFTYSAKSGYIINSVLVDGSSVPITGSYTFSNVQANHTISVTSANEMLTVTASAGANGVISPSGSVSFNYGGSQTFTITPNAGYHIANITANGASVTVTSPSGQTYQFSAVSADSSLTATFAINTYTITVTQTTNGVIAPSTSAVDYGATPSFTITPNTGYHIKSITVDGSSVAVTSSSGQTVSFTNVQATHTITASFAVDTFNITASAGADGSISPSETISVNYGGNQTFNITANTGYYIVDVRVNGSSVGAVSSYTFNNVQAAYTISATFALSPAIYGIAVALAIVAIVAILLVSRKSKKAKAKTLNKLEN